MILKKVKHLIFELGLARWRIKAIQEERNHIKK